MKVCHICILSESSVYLKSSTRFIHKHKPQKMKMPRGETSRLFDVGQKVMARWPKTSLYFSGEIIDFNDIEYLIRFDDEDKSELAVKYKDTSLPFSRTRSRSRSLGRSTKASSKSPSRRSPSRKSPGRPPTSKPSSSRSPSRRSASKKLDTSPNKSPVVELRNEIDQIDKLPELKNRSTTTTDVSSRQSARIASFEKKISYTEVKSNSTNASIGNNIKIDAKSVLKSVQEKNRFAQFLKRLLVATWVTAKSVPLAAIAVFFPLVLTLVCTAKQCKMEMPKTLPKPEIFYHQKRLLMLVAGAVTLGVSIYQEIDLQKIYILLRPLLIAFTCIGIVLSVLLYIKSFYASRDSLNPAGNTGYYIADWIEGREINPRIGTFDIKYFLFRIALVLTILISALTVGKEFQTKGNKIFVPLLLSASMKAFYFLDWIVYEDSFFTTFEYLNVGTGLVLCVFYMTMPFLFTFDTRYVLNHGDDMPWYCLTAIVALYVIGYLVMKGANSQKHTFRTNPAHPSVARFESIPTSSGRRLLVSGLWGVVRHPNYLGDIIMNLAMTLLCGFKHVIPWTIFVFILFNLYTRMSEVEKACKGKYGLAWASYKARVPSRIIPKVF
ncbi:Lamin-B receptor [Armadillidium vulgare]|nr:Lamin-B receptor [Armadillidium vulgare]